MTSQVKEINFKRMSLLFMIVMTLIFTISCTNNKQDNKKYKGADYGGGDETSFSNEYKFDDGLFCAEIEYYNPKTNKKSKYNLPVEVKNNKLIRIQFENGGWLDASHFDPPKPNDDQYFEFTDDRGREFTVGLLEDEEDCDALSSE